MKKAIPVSFAMLLALTAPGIAQDTLFADMGGQAGIDRIVEASVENYLADPRIKAVFEKSNMDRVRAQFKIQFCQIAGGPCQYTGHGMAEAHKGLHLTTADFNAVVEDLQDAMDKVGLPFATQNRFLARLAPMQRHVVTK
jgi:hemoglobin